jgi:hypothetical protein
MARSVSLDNVVLLPIGAGSSTPRAIGEISGVIYAYTTGGDVLVQSTNKASTWDAVGDITAQNPLAGTGNVRAIFACSDGEVLVVRQRTLIRSVGWGSGAVTWLSKQEPIVETTNVTSQFKEWGFDFDGTNGILTEYANTWDSVTFPVGPTSVWITTNQGVNFTQVLVTGSGDFTDEISHWHGVCVDSWQSRFYVSMGHGTQVGVYSRAISGGAWYEVDVSAYSPIVTQPFSCFTTLTATPQGITLGSDDNPESICRIAAGQAIASQVMDILYLEGDDAPPMNWWMEANNYMASSEVTLLGTKLTPDSLRKPSIYYEIDGRGGLLWVYPNSIATTTNKSIRNFIDAGDGDIVSLIQIENDFYQLSAELIVTNGGLMPITRMDLEEDLLLQEGVGSASFVRATTSASYINAAGLLTLAGANVPRFEAAGLLVEGASENLCFQSNDFDTSPWVLSSGTVAQSPDVSPDGTLNAWRVTSSVDPSSNRIQQLVAIPTLSVDYLFSVWTKGPVGVQGRLNVQGSGPETQTFTHTGDWQRISLLVPAVDTASTPLTCRIYGAVDSGSGGQVGDYTDACFAQLEELGFASSYIPTTVAAVVRDADELEIPAANVPATSQNFSFGITATPLSNPAGSPSVWRYGSESPATRLYTSTTQYIGGVNGTNTSIVKALTGVTSRVMLTHDWIDTPATGQNQYINAILGDTDVATQRTGAISQLFLGRSATSSGYWFGNIQGL